MKVRKVYTVSKDVYVHPSLEFVETGGEDSKRMDN